MSWWRSLWSRTPADAVKTDRLTVAEAGTLGEVSRASNLLLIVISAVTVAMLVWAYVTDVETVARTQGRVIPSGKLQVVQNLEGGIVSLIHVKSGQRVNEGDLLVTLDQTQFRGELQSRNQQLRSLSARMARLNAESIGAPLRFAPNLTKSGGEFVDLETAAFLNREAQLRSQLNMLQAQIDQKTQELQEMRIALATATKTLELGREERAILSMLVSKGLEPQLELVRLDRTLADAVGRQDTARTSIMRLQAAIEETRARKESASTQFRAEARVEANKTLAELRSLEEVMPALADKKGRAEVRSPVSGIVNRVLMNTIGGVAKPGEPLVEVVPVDDQLVFEAQVSPTDIGFVKVGQLARIKLTAYDYAIFGAMTGTVKYVAADAVSNEKGESFFIARIETPTPVLESRGKQLLVMPGMQAQLDIITGYKTIWNYLSKPFLAVRENAFRER